MKVTGKALSYTGAPVDGAKVKFRVTRETRYPRWFSYWWSPPAQSPQEIAHGSARTREDGSFEISFESKPDPAKDKSLDPTFNFSISVDVIDQTGETRSGSTSVRLGYKSMELSLSTPSWLTADKPVSISLSSRTLDGKPLTAKGTIEVYALTNPVKPVPKTLYPQYYGYYRYGRISRSSQKADPSNWETWEDGDKVDSSSFTTSDSGSGDARFTLAPGAYRARIKSTDRFGNEITSFHPFMVLSKTAPTLNVAVPNLIQLKSSTVKVGETLEALWGTGYSSGRAYIEVEHQDKIVNSFWTEKRKNTKTFPVSCY